MMRHLAIGLAVTVALVVGLELGPSQSVWSAGVLSTVHGQLGCEDCHDAFSSFANADKCVACHQQRRLVPADQFSGSHCAACHADHRGRDTSLAAAPLQSCQPCHAPAMVPLGARERPGGMHKARSFHPYHDVGAMSPAAATSSAAATHAAAATSSAAATDLPAGQPPGPCLGCHPIDVAAHAQEVDAGTADDCSACHAGVHGDDPSAGPAR